MIAAILAFFQAVPALMGGLTNFTNKYYDSKVQIYAARVGGDVSVAKDMLHAEVYNNSLKTGWLEAVGHSPVLSFVVVGFALPFMFYLNKVIIYDICLGLGSTPTLNYPLLTDWGGIIISGIFITSGTVGAIKTYINRKQP